MNTSILIENLTKTYTGGVEALKGVSLSIPEGTFLGLLGPNGAGKSTTIGILSGLVKKTSGKVVVAGFDQDVSPERAKLQLGVVPQEFNFNIFEPCIQVVTNQAGYYGVPLPVALERVEPIFKELDLWEKRNTPAGRLSGGMKRRLMIARALVHQPNILILDEPTAGVDVALRRSMWTYLEKRNQEGMTIILTTHYLEEAEALCKRIAIIDKGTIIADLPKADLVKQLSFETLIVHTQSPLSEVPTLPMPVRLVEESQLEVDLQQGQTVSELVALLADKQIVVSRLNTKSNRLEELFVNLVGQS